MDFYLPETQDQEVAKCFLNERWLIRITAHHTFSRETDCAVIQQVLETCSKKVTSLLAADIARDGSRIIALNPITGT